MQNQAVYHVYIYIYIYIMLFIVLFRNGGNSVKKPVLGTFLGVFGLHFLAP